MAGPPPESEERLTAPASGAEPELTDAGPPARAEITQSPVTATAIGLASGALSALLGVGGGLLMVPAMVYMLRVRQPRAHGTSLAVMLPAAVAGVYRYNQAGTVDWELVLPLVAGSVFGALIGAGIANTLGAGALKRVFGVFVIATGGLMIAVPAKYSHHLALIGPGAGSFLIGLVGLVAGILSGLLGVGGGTIMVPAIVFLLSRDQHVAQGVSLAVIIPVSLSGAWIHARKGNVIPTLGVWLAVGAVIGATVVGHAVQRYSSDTLRFLFGVFLVIMGVTLVARKARTARR
jgi:uncharacterized membrane protein YfcA